MKKRPHRFNSGAMPTNETVNQGKHELSTIMAEDSLFESKDMGSNVDTSACVTMNQGTTS